MSHTVKLSTTRLLELLGHAERMGSERDELFALCACVSELRNRAYEAIGYERWHTTAWTLEPPVRLALRAAMRDQYGNIAAHSLAMALVRGGDRDIETIEHLHPWDAILFRWHQDRVTSLDIEAAMQSAQLFTSMSQQSHDLLTKVIADPFPHFDQHSAIINAMFDGRTVWADLRDNEFMPRHPALLEDLFKRLQPPVAVGAFQQTIDSTERFKDVSAEVALSTRDGNLVLPSATVLSDEGAHWAVSYELGGRSHAFFATANGGYMDVDAVLNHFNAVMEDLGRAGRVYRLEPTGEDGGASGWFVVACRDRFPNVAAQLHIPLAQIVTRIAHD